jgi:hypothetical protein
MTGSRRKFDQDFKKGTIRIIRETDRPFPARLQHAGANDDADRNEYHTAEEFAW